MKIKKLIAGLLAITIVFGAGGVPGNIGKDIFTLSVNAEEYEEVSYVDKNPVFGDVHYELESYYDYEKEEYYLACNITSFVPDAVNVVIPEEIEGYPVMHISAFVNQYSEIQYNRSEKLETVTIPSSVKSLEPPSGISASPTGGRNKSIFNNYPSLKSFTVNKNNKTYYSKDGVLYEHTEDGDKITGYPAAKKDKTYTVPKNITRISYDVFPENTYLENIVIPEDSKIKDYFTYDGVVYSYSNEYHYDEDGNEIIDGKNINYYYCPAGKKKVTLPDGMKRLYGNSYWQSESAFANCKSLKEVVIPDSVTYIDSTCFNNTPLVNDQKGHVKYVGNWVLSYDDMYNGEDEEITIKDGTVGIAAYAFGSDTHNGAWWEWIEHENIKFNLKKINLPESLKYINNSAFDGSMSLKKMIIPENVESIGMDAFRACAGMKTLEYRCKNATVDWEGLDRLYIDELIIADGVMTIPSGVFNNCESLTKVTIPDSVTSIGVDSFCDCTNLKEITIPESVKEIGIGLGFCNLHSAMPISERPRVENFTIKGVKGSAAEKYAKDYGFKFVELKEDIKPDSSSKADSKKDSSSSKPDNSSKKDSSSSKSGDSSKKDDSSKPEKSSSPDSKPDDSSKPDNVKFTKGDVNGNGDINVTDIAMVAAHIKGIKPLTDEQQKSADVSGDNEVNVTDIAMIAAHIKGIKAIG